MLCFVVVQRVARPSVLVSLSSALGYDGVSIGRDELARLVVTRAAADGATAEFFSHDILDGTRTLREESVEGVADALHANFVDAKPLRLRCEPPPPCRVHRDQPSRQPGSHAHAAARAERRCGVGRRVVVRGVSNA